MIPQKLSQVTMMKKVMAQINSTEYYRRQISHELFNYHLISNKQQTNNSDKTKFQDNWISSSPHIYDI